ncbi:MAG TPA: response regulator [Bacteroidia bacterium]|jgi:CheY-like chemotaxis protein|nr:response regulator [Bacteroidia bacterium]
MRILVVDDDMLMLTAISKKLEEKHYEVSTTTDAVEALTILADNKIDLIISDVVMPCISGFTFLSMLKNFYYSKVPLILISSYNQENVILQANHLGASYFLPKPINYDQLILKIKEFTSDIS